MTQSSILSTKYKRQIQLYPKFNLHMYSPLILRLRKFLLLFKEGKIFAGILFAQIIFCHSWTLTLNHRFPMEDQSVLVGEMDGVRILSSRSHELLQEVPLVCQDIFKIASMAPGALLLEAHREYEVRIELLHCGTWKTLSLSSRLMSIPPEIKSEGWRVPEGAQGAEHAGGGSETVCGGCSIWIWPPDPEISAAGEPSPLWHYSVVGCQWCCSCVPCPPGGVLWEVFSGGLQPRSVCGDLQRAASVERRPSEQRGAAADISSVSSHTCRPCRSVAISSVPHQPPNRQSLHSHFRFKHLTLQVLIDRWVCSQSLLPSVLPDIRSHVCFCPPQAGVPAAVPISNQSLPLPEDPRLSWCQQSPQTLGFLQG